MAVGIDIVVDPSGAVSGGRVATASLDQIEKAADGATSTIARLEKEMAVLTVKQQQGSKAAAQFASTQSLSGKATATQRVQIERLTGEVYDLQVATAGADKGMKTFGRSSMNVANIGYQIQDSMVQAQMGTSGFVIAAQQLPQALVGFGAIGSVVGTAVALVSVGLMALNPNLADATTSTDKLTGTMEDLNRVLGTTQYGVVGLSDDMLALYGTSEQLAKVQLSLAFSKATLAVEQASDAALEATLNFGTFFTDLGAGAVNLEELDKRTQSLFGGVVKSIEDIKNSGTFAGQGQIVSSVELLSDKFKIAEGDSISLLRAYQALLNEKSPQNISELSDIVSNITLNTPEATLAFRQFAADIGEVSQKASSASDIINFVNGALSDLGKTVQAQSGYVKGYETNIEGLSQNLIVLQTRISGNAREAAVQEAVFRSGAKVGSEYAQQVGVLAGQQYDLQQQLKTTNTAVKEFDQDGAYLEKLEKQAEAIGLNSREQAMLRAEQNLSKQATSDQIAQARQLAGALFDATAEQKRQDDITRTFRNTIEGLNPSVDNYVIRMAALTEAHNQGYISAQQLSAEMVKVQQTFSPDSITFAESFNLQFQQTVEGAQNMEASLGEIYGNTFSTLSSSIGQATTDMLLFGASGEDAARQVAQAVAGQLISSLVELGVQYVLNAALGETIAAASLAATSASAAAMGVAWATPAALASLATLGTNSAPAAAAVTGTVAAAQGVALAGAAIPSFAEGGLAYGPGTGTSDSFTANLSNGEFVMPQRETARNLGTLQSMRAGNDVTSGSPVKVNVVNQTTGRVDSASAEWVSRDELTVILAEEVPGIVAGEFNDEYSKTNRAFNSSYVATRNL